MFPNDLEGVILNLATFPRQSRRRRLIYLAPPTERKGPEDLYSLSPYIWKTKVFRF